MTRLILNSVETSGSVLIYYSKTSNYLQRLIFNPASIITQIS